MTEGLEKPKMSIEFGAYAVDKLQRAVLSQGLKAIFDAVESCRSRFGHLVDQEFIPYEGLNGRLSLVSPIDDRSGLSEDNAEAVIDAFNEKGIPFNLALNGGFQYSGRGGDEPIDLRHVAFGPEYRTLSHMANQGRRYNVRNYVTIFLDNVRAEIERLFPGEFTTIASCTKFTGGWANRHQGLAEYDRAASRYDRVVMLPQHGYPDVVSRFGENTPDKVVVFSYLKCAKRDLGDCFAHHRGFPGGTLDASPSGGIDIDWSCCSSVVRPALPEWMPSRRDFAPTPLSEMFLQRNIDGCPGLSPSSLFDFGPGEAFGSLVNMGVRHFKISRERTVLEQDFRTLTDEFLKARKAA